MAKGPTADRLPVTTFGRRCRNGMSKPLVGRRDGRRVILWGRVCSRALDVAIVFLVLFLIVTCVIGASHEGHFFETWWGGHLFLLLPAVVLLPALAAAGFPLLRWLRVPFERLSDPQADSVEAKAREHTDRRLTRLALASLMAVVGLALLVGFFYVEENERGERAWNRYKQEQEARGDRLDPAVLIPPPVPDDQNFASTPFFAPLFDFVPGTQQPLDPKAVERTSHLTPRYEAASSRLKSREVPRSNSWTLAAIDLPAWQFAFLKGTNSDASEDAAAARAFRLRYGLAPAQTAPPPLQPASASPPLSTNRAEAATTVLAALAEAEPVLEELRAASRRPYSRFNLCYDLTNPAMIHLPHYSVLKRASQVLQLRASAELALGRADQAADDIQFMFRLTDATRGEPLLIGLLVRLAELNITLQPLAEGLARHQWSDNSVARLRGPIASFQPPRRRPAGLARRKDSLWRRRHRLRATLV